jgi:hypothetical protein
MNFTEWLKAKGFDEATLTASQLDYFKQAFNVEMSAGSEEETEPTKPTKVQAEENSDLNNDVKSAMRASALAESKRLVSIKKACKNDEELYASAIENEWDESRIKTEVELKTLRAKSFSKVPNQINDHGIEEGDKQKVLQAGISLACGLDTKDIAPKILEASQKHYRNMGLQELIINVAKENGYNGRENFKSNPREILQFAFGKMQSAFSTISLPLILSNIANKSLKKGFDSVESAWRDIADIASVSDFKTVSRYSLTGDMEFEQITANGEIPHGKVGELGYTNKIASYGKMFAITREMLINDDLNALTKVPMKIGRGGALKVNTVFWTKFLANTSIFSAGNKNLLTGGTSALSIASVTALMTKLKKQTDPDGKTFPVKPARLLVPVELGTLAGQIISDAFVLADGATALTPAVFSNKNPHVGKLALTESAYLSDNVAFPSTFSATAWYLLADPADIAVIEMAFLNGVQSPVIESADADFDTLGIQTRGFLDFGAEFQEYRGGARSNGV